MSYTYNLTSIQVPTPIGPSSFAIGAGISGAFSTGMTTGVSNNLNQLQALAVLAAQVGAPGAYGVVVGCDLSQTTGLNIQVSAGIALMDGFIELVTSSPVGPFQKLLPVAYTLPDASTSFVWLTATGALVSSISTAPPSGAKVFLGTATTSGGSITGIDYSGRMFIQNGQGLRTTADTFAPTDTPAAAVRCQTTTAFGTFHWDGVAHKLLVDLTKQLIQPYNYQVLSADVVLTPTSPNIVAFDGGGASRNITLPDPNLCTPGHSFTSQNVGASNNLVFKNHAGTTIATIAPGNQCGVAPFFSGAVLVWPTSPTTGPVGSLML